MESKEKSDQILKLVSFVAQNIDIIEAQASFQ